MRAAGLVVALLVWSSAALGQPIACGTRADEEELRAIMTDAIRDGFQTHVTNLFTTRLRDYRAPREGAIRGINLGAAAYLASKRQLAAWRLPSC